MYFSQDLLDDGSGASNCGTSSSSSILLQFIVESQVLTYTKGGLSSYLIISDTGLVSVS